MAKILIVDDLPDNRALLEAVLSKADDNYVVTEVGSGEEALEAVEKEIPDIILLDVMMPGMNGFEVCKKLKADKKYSSIPVLFITAMANTDDKVKGFQVGAADYITKPLDIHEVKARVTAHLRIKEAEAERIHVRQLETVRSMIVTYNHEMNQPLTAIRGYVDLLMDDVAEGDETYEILKTIQEQTDRVVKILNKITSIETVETEEYIPGSTMIDLKLEKEVEGKLTKKQKSVDGKVGQDALSQKLEKTTAALKIMGVHLVQAGKVAALGQLSAGIAHELKQPLTGIVGYVEEALEDVGKNSPAIESLKIIKREAGRMQVIVEGIRRFSRTSGDETHPIDINMVVSDSLLLLTKQLRNSNIEIKTFLGEDLPIVDINASQMQQVFVNMISNAKDAMEPKDGGTLTLRSFLAEDGKFVEVTFQDTGCGMSKDVIKRLSEPFFTTKGPEQGTGLGTSISYSIMKMHKGEINITSKVGSGTTMSIRIPVAK